MARDERPDYVSKSGGTKGRVLLVNDQESVLEITDAVGGMRVGGAKGRNIGKTEVSHTPLRAQ
jgi:hypothetical protein